VIRLPTGVRDFLPRSAARRRALAEGVMSVFDAWGYARVITPMFEHADVLARGTHAQAIRFVEPGSGEVVALRPDITPQIARVVATRLADVPGPIRLCYEGSVTRLTSNGPREILQAGVELIDAGEPDGDAEILALAAATLERLELPETRIDVGHVAPAAFVLGMAHDDEARAQIAGALARKDRAGVRRAARALPEAVAPLAEALAGLWGPALPTLDRAMAMHWPAGVHSALEQLRGVLAAFAALAENPPALTLDLGDVRGFAYYTGMKLSAYAAGAPDAVLRGGRYDELVARYGRAARSTGFAIDLEAIAQARRADPPRAPGVATDDPELARALRRAGARAVVQRSAPADWPAWLRGAGLDAALVGGSLILADGTQKPCARDAETILRYIST
jgi:ATP phosphoribosyltransferase regulatory subunit